MLLTAQVFAPSNMDAELIQLAKQTATKYGLDPVLVCAVIEQESAWNQWAARFEPRFLARYIQPLGLFDLTEANLRSTSFGLMQLMGEVARELGYKGPLCQLCDPPVGLVLGCQHLANKFKQHPDVTAALLAWNGGANLDYPAQVLARMDKYK